MHIMTSSMVLNFVNVFWGGGPHEREFCYCLEVDSKSFGVF